MSTVPDKEYVECPKCGWVHFSVSEAFVAKWEAEWRELAATKSERWLRHFGVKPNAPPTRENYLKCFRCGNRDVASFFPTDKVLRGSTIQPVLWKKK